MKNENFGFCQNCAETGSLFPISQGKNKPPLLLCKTCKEDHKKGLPPKIVSKTRYHEMAENLAKKEE